MEGGEWKNAIETELIFDIVSYASLYTCHYGRSSHESRKIIQHYYGPFNGRYTIEG